MDKISLSLFAHKIAAICDEMGAVLQRVAFSPNIKDRLDFSCAVFDAAGKLCAQAAHIPVHLGSMAYAMADLVAQVDWQADDMVIINDPYRGGTHLPDVSLIAPLFIDKQLIGFVVNRAHHADIGAESPGSMPISSRLEEEGIIIPPQKLIEQGQLNESLLAEILGQLKNAHESKGDFSAQISANWRGLQRLKTLIEDVGVNEYLVGLQALNDYAASIALATLSQIPDGQYSFSDFMDDDGQGQNDIEIKATVSVKQGRILVDFTGSHRQVKGNINCPLSVVAAAVYYVFRCLMPDQTPACAGAFSAIKLKVPDDCLLNAQYPAAVAAGNVETSSRVVDVIMGALVQALPTQIPAASQGSMNNLAMGFAGDSQQAAWNYYETIGGGMGAGQQQPGLSGVQSHMTNTLNTPIEVLESQYPIRVRQYQLRQGSGGQGEHCGGDGIIRQYEFLADAQFTLLTERRRYAPWGVRAGQVEKNTCLSAALGINQLNAEKLAAKVTRKVKAGDILTIETPGGGAWSSK